MTGFLRQSTDSQTRVIGPFVDDTDFKTLETGLSIANTDIKLSANGASAASKNSGGGTHIANGEYAVTFNATDTATVGELAITCKMSGSLVVRAKFIVLEEDIYDSLFLSGASAFDSNGRVNVGRWLGTAVTTDGTSSKPDVNVSSWGGNTVAAGLFSGITTLANWLRLIARSDAAIKADAATELGEINNNEGSGAGDYDNETDALEYIGGVATAQGFWWVQPELNLKTTEGLGCQISLRLYNNYVQVDPTTLDASCTATITVREHGEGASTFLIDESFVAADIVSGIFEKEITDPSLVADRQYDIRATITANGTTYKGEEQQIAFG